MRKGKIRWIGDPFADVVRAFRKLYPHRSVEIAMQPIPGKRLGEASFGRGHVPFVTVDPRQSYIGCIDILAHELAHVAAGAKKGHGKQWLNAYDAIRDEYHAIVQRAAKRIGQKSVTVKLDYK